MPEPEVARTGARQSVTISGVDDRVVRRLNLLGAGLMAYGLVGVAIFVAVAGAITSPLDRIQQLSQSVEEQRDLLVDSMLQGETTIREMATGARRMDTSLAGARTATERSSQIALGVAGSMFQLRDAMSISILGTQPLIGLAAGFDDTGRQLEQLSTDLTAIGSSLGANSSDVITTAANLDELASTVATLRTSVATGPAVGISTETLASFRFAIFAVAGWLLLFATGCVLVGLYLVLQARRPRGAVLSD